jgi:hypothetical protein
MEEQIIALWTNEPQRKRRFTTMTQAIFSEGRALIMGVGADLPNTVDDAQGMADILKDPTRCAYRPDQVELLTSEAAGRSSILAGLDRLAKRADENSTVVIYFSGHGYHVKSSIGEAYYLMPFGYNIEKLKDTAISGPEFAEKLKAIKAQKLLLLLDCCHAGGLTDLKAPGLLFAKAPLPPEAQSLFAQGRGRVVIASSQANESSFAGKPYSAFTLALIDALSGAGASRKDGYVRVIDLALHTREIVPGKTNNRQHPIMDFKQSDNFVLAYYAGGSAEPKGLPFTEEPEIEPEPGAWSGVFDQRGQTVHGPQTNIAGNVHGPVFSGQFSGPVAMGGEAIDMRGSTGAIYKPSGSVSQHFGDRIEIHGDGNVIGSGSAAVFKAPGIEQFLKDLRSLRQALKDANLDEETIQAVEPDLEIVESQAKKEKPNKTMIMSKLRSAAEILAAVDGSVGTMERVQALAASLLSLAGRLFG